MSCACYLRIRFIYMSLLSQLATTCAFWVNSERKKSKFHPESNPRPNFPTNRIPFWFVCFLPLVSKAFKSYSGGTVVAFKKREMPFP